MNQHDHELSGDRPLAGKLFSLSDFYRDIDTIYNFSKACPKRRFTVSYVEAMESVLGYPSASVLEKIKAVLGVSEIISKADEQCLFGIFRYMLSGTLPHQIGVHVDAQPWTLIIYISPTVDAPGTAIYRHRETGIFDLGLLSAAQRSDFLEGPLRRDQYNQEAWEALHVEPFRQNNALLFKAQDLLHSNVSTWGHDVNSARITQNFNFQIRN